MDLDQGDRTDIYCYDADKLGLPPCEPGYKTDFAIELRSAQKQCSLLPKCLGVYDYKDDRKGVRFCEGKALPTDSKNRVWMINSRGSVSRGTDVSPLCALLFVALQ